MVDYYLPRQLRYITHDNVVYQRSNTRPAVYGVQTRIVDDSWCIGSGADGLRTAASSPVSIMHMFRNNVLNVSVEVWHQLMLEMMIQRASQIQASYLIRWSDNVLHVSISIIFYNLYCRYVASCHVSKMYYQPARHLINVLHVQKK